MKTPAEEIVELRASVASLKSELDLIKRNLQIKTISDQEFGEYKERISFIEDQLSALKHSTATKNITSNPPYPPYIPYVAPSPVESEFSPSKYLHCKSQLNKEGNY